MSDQNTSKTSRSPVVVVMGHVDHGKTTLLDYIRKSNVAAKEAGGITQGVGAYEITHNTKRITFIDTPGHAAFSKMRGRGAKIADIAVLVVAADDSVQPQTKEAIKVIQEAKLPYVVAINKIDSKGADVEKVKMDLLQANVLLEGLGGDISFQPLSAKTGEGVSELLDHILLITEVEGLTCDLSAPAQGYILEAHLNNKTGITASVIIKNGTLKVGDLLAAGTAAGKIRDLQTFAGEKVKSLTPSAPALIFGFETMPAVGDPFTVGGKATEKIKAPLRKTPIAQIPTGEKVGKRTTFILKANVAGSLEALQEEIAKLKAPGGNKIEILEASVGDVTDGDAKMALSTKSYLIAFKTKATTAARTLMKAHAVKSFESEIIYELLEAIQKELSGENKKIIAGDMEILAVFSKDNPGKQIIGGKVLEGAIKNQSSVEVHRDGKEIGTGKVANTQSMKKDVQQIEAGQEGGLLFSSQTLIEKGDHLIARPQ